MASKATKSRSPTKAAPGSPSKQKLTATGFPITQANALLSNFDLECQSRRSELERALHNLIKDLKRRCEAELTRLPESLHQMLVKEFYQQHQGNVRQAVEGSVGGQVKEQHAKEDIQRDEIIEDKSPRKRSVSLRISSNSSDRVNEQETSKRRFTSRLSPTITSPPTRQTIRSFSRSCTSKTTQTHPFFRFPSSVHVALHLNYISSSCSISASTAEWECRSEKTKVE